MSSLITSGLGVVSNLILNGLGMGEVTPPVVVTPPPPAPRVTEPIHGGALNDSAESVIRKHLPPSLAGRAWDALIAALAVADELNWENARLAFDQLFKSTASGLYLDRKAADDGLARPPDIGMPDDLFRQLAIKTSASKLTPEVLLEILEVFYGRDSVRASATTELTEPFNLSAGDDLSLLMDERDPVQLFFEEGDATLLSNASAQEVAAAITRGLRQYKNKGFAVAVRAPGTDAARVSVYSGSLGLGSSVRVTGGRAQLGLRFPSLLAAYGGAIEGWESYTWTASSPAPGVTRLSLTRPTGSSKLDLSLVQEGDYVVFEAATSILPAGIYNILDVGVSISGSSLVQFFDVAGTVPDHVFVQTANRELTFYRPTRQTIQKADSRTVVVAQRGQGQLDLVIPATTQAVGRTSNTAAYPSAPEPLALVSATRTGAVARLGTAAPHGFATGDQVLVENVIGGGFNGIFTVSNVPSASEFEYSTPSHTWNTTGDASEGQVFAMRATASAVPGPFLFEPASGAAVTGIETETSMDLFAGRQYAVLNVADANAFPDAEGWLVVGFGTDTAVSPVKYLSRLSATSLALDYGFRFPTTNLQGAKVALLKHKGVFVPDAPEEVGACYLTASSAGRGEAVRALEAAVAAGVDVGFEVRYPGDRGLGGEGLPVTGQRVADKVAVWGGDDLDAELAEARGE